MSETLQLQPKAGFRVLDPETLAFLPDEGARVNNSQYWQRRLLDGSVVKMQLAPPAMQAVRTATKKEG